MIELDIHFSDFPWSLSPVTLAEASEIDLRYKACLGDVILRIDDCDLSARWGWVPLVDFIVSLRYIVDDLARSAEGFGVFDFTESDDTITFRRSDTLVYVEASYSDNLCTVPWVEFRAAIVTFTSDALEKILKRYPELEENSFIKTIQMPPRLHRSQDTP